MKFLNNIFYLILEKFDFIKSGVMDFLYILLKIKGLYIEIIHYSKQILLFFITKIIIIPSSLFRNIIYREYYMKRNFSLIIIMILSCCIGFYNNSYSKTKTNPNKKTTSVTKKITAKNITSSKKSVPSKKNISSKKLVSAKKNISSKKSVPTKKITSSKKSVPSKKITSSKKSVPTKRIASDTKKKSSKPTKYATSLQVLQDSLLIEGVIYKIVKIKSGRASHIVYVTEADLNDNNLDIQILKAGNRADGLEMIPEMARGYDSLSKNKIICAVNANFWRAYSLFPIGPTIANGEIIEMLTHKKWSSLFIDNDNLPYIDNFYINGTLEKTNGSSFTINYVNRRKDSLGIVLYNRFCGDTVPFIPVKTFARAMKEAESDTNYLNDLTEEESNPDSIAKEIESSKRSASIEFSLQKAALKYLSSPAINKIIKCTVIKVDTGAVGIPDGGCVISFGKDISQFYLPKVGDTLDLEFSTNIYTDVEFTEAIAGTPRLVRHGIAKHEAYEEGSRGRRFINRALPRTAIGFNRSKDKIYFAVIEPASRKNHTSAANLAQMAIIMQKLGCYNAMNLDGGGSSIMVLGHNNILRRNSPSTSRKISVAIGIVFKNKTSAKLK
jgi:hypothetical protein